MNIVFRVDSSHVMGIGHIMRCMALADVLRDKGHNVDFICRDMPGNYIFALKDKNFTVIELPYDIRLQKQLRVLSQYQQWLGESKEVDLQQTLSYLAKMKQIDWLVVDHYGIDDNWEAACRPYVKKIMIIDDLADRAHDCDLLLDQNYSADSMNRYVGLVTDYCKKLLGPYFALMRPEFNEARKKIINRDGKVERLMVSLGGTDASNGTQKVLEAIYLSKCSSLQVDVVVGAASQHKNEIQKWCEDHQNYHFHYGAKNMAEIMGNADLAIGAGGGTTWERCCLGLPSLVIQTANNQEELIKQGVSANIIEYLGDLGNLSKDKIAQRLNEIIADPEQLIMMSQAGMALVDGLGVNRVVTEMMKL
ncbi:MAG: UDP-2,4-diacetamido-2,4,6-trideoxy-beta-L-altropyranose hydrolase [Gammaproteobacteria bacterium]|nr:UDP-2,4-diacetamido-2,4,6-trideoxy-beta-L-altropyranose hydrolase [Gammaproteobacteria bacterium]